MCQKSVNIVYKFWYEKCSTKISKGHCQNPVRRAREKEAEQEESLKLVILIPFLQKALRYHDKRTSTWRCIHRYAYYSKLRWNLQKPFQMIYWTQWFQNYWNLKLSQKQDTNSPERDLKWDRVKQLKYSCANSCRQINKSSAPFVTGT